MDWGSAEVQRGLVQGALTALGVFVSAVVTVGIWYGNRSKERADAAALRKERGDDLRLALWSDILPIWIGLYTLGSAETKLTRVRDAFKVARERDQNFTPFVVPAAEPLFVKRLTDDVAMLETDEIEPVVRFYHQLARMRQVAATMRDAAFAALPLNRRELGLTRLTKMEIQAEVEAKRALGALERRLNLRDEMRMEMQMRRASVNRLTD